jgi:hypothetical protein
MSRFADGTWLQSRDAITLELLARAANKLKRELFRLPAVRVYRGYEYHEALEAHAMHLPALDPTDLPTVEALRREGVVSAPAESLGLPDTTKMLAACDTLARELRGKPQDERVPFDAYGRAVAVDNAPRLPIARMMQLPEIYMWGLNERLLSVVENYIGLPIRYHGADLRREFADGAPNDVRQWHIDAEDRRMFKVIIYLNDVQPGGGPFQYLSRGVTTETARRLRYGSGFVSDDAMRSVVPQSQWTECLAPSHTAIVADTCKVFHRAQPPRASDRYSVTFSWTSTTAIKSYPSMPLSADAIAYIQANTGERQRACLPPRTAAYR